MNPYSRAFTRQLGFFYTADKDGGGGGGELAKGTLKERLEAANGRIGELDGEKSKLAKDLKDEQAKVTALEGDKTKLTADLKSANEKVTSLEGDKTKLAADVKVANEKVTKLEGEAKTADERAQEKAAANGHPPVQTSEAAKTQAQAKDGAALYAEYEKLKGVERGEFFREHEKALMAYAKQLEKEQAKA